MGLLIAVIVARLTTGSAKTFLLSESTIIRNNFLLAFIVAVLPTYVAVRCGFAALQGKRHGLWGTTLVVAFWCGCVAFQVLSKIGLATQGVNSEAGVYLAHSLLFDITSLLWLSVLFAMQVYALLANQKAQTSL